jgi:Na+/H+ antiporter NhaD/arsenite permease-like protein
MNETLIMGVSIFILTYLVIVSETMNRTVVAMVGAVIMMLFHIESQEQAIHHIDMNTIGLLIGMMIIVNIMRRTGVFEYIAIKSAKLAKGDPWKIIVLFSVFTAVSSALLDNVTTILLVVPITIGIAKSLKINPVIFLVPEILIANIGGTATLIGDPPNIMIGSSTNLGFVDFLVNLGPIVVVIFVVTIMLLKWKYKKKMTCSKEDRDAIMQLNELLAIKDKVLLVKSIVVLGLTILGFMFHQLFEIESATVALSGAAVLLFISKIEVEEVLMEVEWPTIFFFASLFILVGALVEIGVIDYLAEQMMLFTGGDLVITMLVILWGSAIASSFLDNIPFVATMIPLIKSIAAISTVSVTPLWWALALGACLGGNGTLVGASANVIVSGMLEKQGYKLGFVDYMKVGFPIMIVSVLISTGYLLLFYV